MRRENNLMTCTVAGLAKFLFDNVEKDEHGEWGVPACDFCIIDDDSEERSLEEVRKEARGWYGVKAIDAGFDSECLVVISDYYGGGCASLAQIWNDDIDGGHCIQDLIAMLISTLSVQELARTDTLLFVELLEKREQQKT